MPAKDVTHTPGPWHVESGCIVQTNGVNIGGADRNDSRTSPCERDRNVDLMAAAPEMLNLLQQMVADPDTDLWLNHKARVLILRALGKDRP